MILIIFYIKIVQNVLKELIVKLDTFTMKIKAFHHVIVVPINVNNVTAKNIVRNVIPSSYYLKEYVYLFVLLNMKK